MSDTPESLEAELSHAHGERRILTLAYRAVQLAKRLARELAELRKQVES